MSWKTTR